jgi:UV DNA damage endonuclease
MVRSTRAAAGRATRGFHSAVTRGLSSVDDIPMGSSLSDVSRALELGTPRGKEAAVVDPEADEDGPADLEEVKEALSRPAPVNSDYLPLPWKGRLGYVSFNW